jgi:hypothetical protein
MSNIGFNVNIDTQLSKLSKHLLNTDKTNVRSDLENIDHSYQKAIVKEREDEFNKWHEEKIKNDITIKKVNDLTLNQLYENFINTFVNIVDDMIKLFAKTNQNSSDFVSTKEGFYSSIWNFIKEFVMILIEDERILYVGIALLISSFFAYYIFVSS